MRVFGMRITCTTYSDTLGKIKALGKLIKHIAWNGNVITIDDQLLIQHPVKLESNLLAKTESNIRKIKNLELDLWR
jgi:hypothetical protein